MLDDDCFLCAAALPDLGEIPWHDTPIMESDHGIAVPGIGALDVGYLLVAPKVHVRSTALLETGAVQSFAGFVESVLHRIESLFSSATVFEHGGGADNQERTSACIDHAHIHIMPGTFGLPSSRLSEISRYSSIREFLETECGRSTSYLLYREPGSPYVLSADIEEPQFFRRHIAARLGRFDEWDYAAAPNYSTVRRTLDRMIPNR